MNDVCPNCGYCKHCGRGGQQFIPAIPAPQPWYPWHPWGPTWTSPTYVGDQPGWLTFPNITVGHTSTQQ